MMDTSHRRLFTWLFASNSHTRMLELGDKYTDVGLFQFLVGGNGKIYWIEGGYQLDVSQWTNEDKNSYQTLVWKASGGTLYEVGTTAYYNRINHWKQIKDKWPHLNFYVTLRQDGAPTIFEALVQNYNGAQTTLVSQIGRLLTDFSWADGIDYDFERLHSRGTSTQVANFARAIYNAAKAKGKLVNWDLPPMQGPSVPTWEAWCDYSKMQNYFDSAVIMSYAFSWAGSAPAPIGPKWWMDDTYNYASKVIPKNKLLLGIGGFGFRWDITKIQTKDQDGSYDTYRGASGGMWAWLSWMDGELSHTDGLGSRPNTQTQPYIPYASFYDQESHCPYMYLHIYDYLYSHDYHKITKGGNIALASLDGRQYATTYSKKQMWLDEMYPDGIIKKITLKKGIHTTGAWNSILDADNVAIGVTTKIPNTYVAPLFDESNLPICDGQAGEEQGVLTVNFTTTSSAEVVLHCLFPFFGRDSLDIRLDGVSAPLPIRWWDQGRLAKRHFKIGTVSAGAHTLTITGPDANGNGSSSGFALYDIFVAPTFVNKFVNAAIEYNALLRPFKGWMNGEDNTQPHDVYPNLNKFKLVAETLRRSPDYMPIWPDDWRYDSIWANFSPYWGAYLNGSNLVHQEALTGTCEVYMGKTKTVYDHDKAFSAFKTGTLTTRSSGEVVAFLRGLDAPEPHVRAQFNMYSDSGNYGILVGVKDNTNYYMVQFFLASSQVNGMRGRVKLFKREGGAHIAVPIMAKNAANQVDANTVACELYSSTKITCEVKVLNGIIKVYRGNTDSLGTSGVTNIFNYDANLTSGSVGFRTNDSAVEMSLYQLGHANRYNPREKYSVKVTDKNGSVLLHTEDIGKVDRTDVSYDDPVYGTFKITTDVEEYQTRNVAISKEWDYFQSDDVILPQGDYLVEFRAQDIGVWFSYMFLCDADGASIVYYNDNSTINYYMNRAKYEWELAGVGFWVFGNEDDSLYMHLPSHVQ